MYRFFLLISGLLLSGSLAAQTPVRKASVRLGVDMTSLEAPDAVGPRYVGRLAIHARQDRFVLAAEGGYMHLKPANELFNDIDPGPDRRERYTADLTLFYDLLPQPRHALRLGAGVSVWAQRDDTFRSARAFFSPTGLQGVAVDRWQRSAINSGFHAAAEYEWLFHPRWGADLRLRVVDLNKAGTSLVAGAGVSHRF